MIQFFDFSGAKIIRSQGGKVIGFDEDDLLFDENRGPDSPVENEFGISNTFGTLAMLPEVYR